MIGVVVIGRNEGERLVRCLASLTGRAVVYVDSGSTDDSLAAAETAGAMAVRLDPKEGFTAARARNLGYRKLMEGPGPRPHFVQFVDGDCEVAAGWIDAAAERLSAAPALAAVAGRRRERFPDASIFNRQCDMEWNTPPGDAAAVGGDAMYRVAAFDEAGGFDGDFICGEEPELCLRLRRKGWRIERLDIEMTLHDAAILNWRQWARRTRRGGWAFAEGAATYGAGPERYNMKERRSIVVWGGLTPALIFGALIASALLAFTEGSCWIAPAALAGAALLAYPAMAARIGGYRRRAFGDPPAHARIYGRLVMLGKPHQFLGVLDYRRSRRTGEKAVIIEYKGAQTPGKDA